MQPTERHGRRIWNFRVSREAAERQSRIDLADGDEILLHIKVLTQSERVVINSRAEKGWGKEIGLKVPAALMERHLDIELRQEKDHFLISLPTGDAAPYDRHFDRLLKAQLRLSKGIVHISPEGELDAGALHARITRADIMHVAGEILYPDLRWADPDALCGAQLLLLIDGRLSGSIPLPRPAADRLTPSAEFVIDLDAGAFVSDGMMAEIVLLMGDTRRVLAHSHLRSGFSGAMERCTESIVTGFVCNPDLPRRPVLVDIFLNDAFQATIPANLERPDLAALEAFAGQAGFQFRFPRPVHLPLSMDVKISARIHNTDLELVNSPWWICRAVSMADPLRAGEAAASSAMQENWA
ncbi:hypothetical protein [Muricoccus pecuniae]|uniref:Galectin domain-containing protein n=1 Tax=Muricoccus pecuniae TaxID=693023 RepID=A0A840XYS5_9PROT|nr:hypothetical protein [Roseomonas pecuniae]MBB5693046.1 hypothetical protein [Roseomonas pecuniae]